MCGLCNLSAVLVHVVKAMNVTVVRIYTGFSLYGVTSTRGSRVLLFSMRTPLPWTAQPTRGPVRISPAFDLPVRESRFLVKTL